MPDAGPDTVIGNDCWIGTGATILPGAQLGDGVIVGAGAVVDGEIADYSIVSGNRATVLRMRFEADQIKRIKAIGWWNWPIEKILAHEGAIAGGDINALEVAAH
jgi:virginiamycin A acetyltransferase